MPPHDDDAPAPSRRHGLLAVLASVVIIVGVIVGGVFTFWRSFSSECRCCLPLCNQRPRPHWARELRTSFFRGNVSATGHNIPITGSGAAVLSNPQLYTATVTFAAPGYSLLEKEIFADGHFYMGLETGGQDISSVLPGKQWIEIPVPVGTGNSPGTGTSDPLAQLQLLAAKGNTVTSLGSQTIDGIPTSGYSVSISRQNLVAAEQQFISSSGLDAAAQERLSQASKNLPSLTMSVWFDASKLLRRMGFASDETQNGQTVSVTLNMDFVNYGAQVSISAPPPGEVASYSQFVSADDALSGFGN